MGNIRFRWFFLSLSATLLIAVIPTGPSNAETLSEKQISERLDNLSEADKARLEQDTAQALMYYYAEDYPKALPIFKRISDHIETLDLKYWIGTSATKTGDCDLAIHTLEGALASHPELDRIRLALGAAYQKCGRLRDAEREFNKLKHSATSPVIQQQVSKYLAARDTAAEKWKGSLRFTQSYQYDSNITSGPAEGIINDGKFPVVLGKNNRELSGDNWISELRANTIYDIGETGRFLWNGGLNAYYSHSFEDTDFNYMIADIYTGPWYTTRSSIFKIPAGYFHQQYGNESLSDTFYVDPSMEHFFTDTFSMRAGYTFSVERYTDDDYEREGYDNASHMVYGGPVLYIGGRRHLFSGTFGYKILDADSDRQTYDLLSAGVSWFSSFPTGTDLFISYKWSTREYDAPSSGLYSKSREDDRNTFVAVIAQNFLDHYFAAFEFTYIDNSSNSDLYDFDKKTYTLSVGVKF